MFQLKICFEIHTHVAAQHIMLNVLSHLNQQSPCAKFFITYFYVNKMMVATFFLASCQSKISTVRLE